MKPYSKAGEYLNEALTYRNKGETKMRSNTVTAEINDREVTITVEEIVDKKYFIKACNSTSGFNVPIEKADFLMTRMYKAEHSPIRMRKFYVTVDGCPTFVANHFVRHTVGNDHFHRTHRSDRIKVADEDSNRMTPTHFEFSTNAQALIYMARKRLCTKASKETRQVMECIRECMRDVDNRLASAMVPDCEYRSGVCYEMEPCGKCMTYKEAMASDLIRADVGYIKEAYRLLCGTCLYADQKKYCRMCPKHETKLGLETILKGAEHEASEEKM